MNLMVLMGNFQKLFFVNGTLVLTTTFLHRPCLGSQLSLGFSCCLLSIFVKRNENIAKDKFHCYRCINIHMVGTQTFQIGARDSHSDSSHLSSSLSFPFRHPQAVTLNVP